ncbi:FHA domain-containing protein [uncultured Microbacterium sp.]|uniref:FHA domain-containing protein n=1 Tax=uncultured Microbacterium sp. TaxID=191216 RepID=UPI0025FCC48E|nr:FHA domain-containing protein [uncultured Microbacterium sp.]
MLVLSLIAAIAGALLVPAVALHIWYAIGLARVFDARGVETWRAWVPVVNDAEIFRLGRIDPVRAVLLLVPFVNVYALVLKARAAHRIGTASGRGAGTTALAVLFPPVWSTLLASGGKARDAASPEPTAPSPVEAPVSAEPAGPIAAVPGVAAAAAGSRSAAPEPEAPAVIPTLPGPVEIAPELEHTSLRRSARAADDVPPSASAPGVSAAGSPAPAAASDSAPSLAAASAPASASPEPAPGSAVADAPAPASAAASAPAPVASTPATSGSEVPSDATAGPARAGALEAADPAAPDATIARAPGSESAAGVSASAPADPPSAITATPTFERVEETTDVTDAPSTDAADAAAAPVDEQTQLRPRSRRRGEWTLGLPDGRQVPLTSRTVVLGRKPAASDESVQAIAVVDSTRTVSKQHARLDWTVTGWTVTDLDSTNGVTLVLDDGRAERIGAGGTAPVPVRFRLGDAHLELRPAGPSA